MIGGSKGLEGFLSRWNIGGWQTSPRKLFNVFMLIGLFIGIAGAVSLPMFYYFFLGLSGMALGFVLGLVYVAFSFLGFATPLLLLPAIAIYGMSWLYFNMRLSQYENLARKRISDIETISPLTTNDILEKGILQGIILQEHDRALETLRAALSLEGGDALRWYIGGVALGRIKMYRESLQALDKATQASPDRKLESKIKRNRKIAQKKLG